MKKICYVMMMMISTVTFVSCDMYNDVKPRNQDDTIWVSENPDIFFTVADAEKGGYTVCLGILKTSEIIYNIEMDFDYGSGVTIHDYNILKKNNFIYQMEDIILRADCDFSKNECNVTVTESFIDSIKADDEITFNKADKLPDWANEISEG